MRRLLVFLANGVLLLMLQASLSEALGGPYVPDLLLAALVFMGVFLGPMRGAILAFGLGYLADLVSGGFPGLTGISYLAVFFATRWVSRIFYARNLAFPIIMTLFLGVGHRLLAAGVLSAFEGMKESAVVDWLPLLGRSAVSAAFAPLVFRWMYLVEAASGKGFPLPRSASPGLR